MKDPILNGTNPAADARLIADVMAAEPDLKLTGNDAYHGYQFAYACMERESAKIQKQVEILGNRWESTRWGIAENYDVETNKAAYQDYTRALAESAALSRAMVAMGMAFNKAYFGR